MINSKSNEYHIKEENHLKRSASLKRQKTFEQSYIAVRSCYISSFQKQTLPTFFVNRHILLQIEEL